MNFRKMSLFVVFALVAVSLGPTTHHSAAFSKPGQCAARRWRASNAAADGA